MSTIDERIVSLKFDNRQFEVGVATSLSSIKGLQNGLELKGATKGLEAIQDAASKVDCKGLSSGVDTIKSSFSALQVVAITALTKITSSIMDTGKQLISSLTIDPIKDGFKEYETQMNAIQTIMANTSSKGTTLDQVNSALKELNTYSDKTIYNFTEMTKNIGTFTAAGVDLDKSTAAIKGIANLAAVSGSTSEQASTAMYQLSQAMAAGTVKLQDWNSVVNAGMGGEVFQNSLKDTARAHGIAIDDMIKKEGSFRETLQKGWLTTDILTETLSKFTGDLTAEQLKSMGYTDEQIAGIIKMGQTAQDAATKVKTVTQLMDTLKEAVGSGWAQTWQIIFGDFEEAKSMFTEVSDTLGGMINESSTARNDMLQGWKDLGGRTVLIDALKTAFQNVMDVVKAIGGAFREIFPATTSEQLFGFTEGLKNLMDSLKLSDANLTNLKSTFKGFFAILDIGKQLLIGLVSGISTILTGSDKLGSSILSMTGSLGEWLTALDNTIKSSGVINNVIQSVAQTIRNVFNGTGNTLEYLGSKFVEIRDAIVKEINFNPWKSFGDLLSNISKTVEWLCTKLSELEGKISDVLAGFGKKFDGINIGDAVKTAYEGVSKLLVGQGDEVKKADDKMQSTFTDSMNNFMSNISKMALAAIGFGVARIMVTLHQILKKNADVGGLFDMLKGSIAGGIEKITGTLDSVRGCLKSYQDQLKAGLLIKIATAIGILAASIVAVSLVDSGKLASSLAAIGGLFAQLLVSMKLFTLIGEMKGSAIKSSVVMITMSTSLLILANAMRILGQLDIKQTITSLAAVITLMGTMTLATKILSKDSGTFVKGCLSIIAFAEAIKILADACIKLSNLDYEQLKKGLIGIGVIMAELAGFLKMNPTMGIKTAASVLILATALNVMYYAVKNIGSLDWEDIKKGLMGIGGVLAEVAVFDKLTSNAKNVIATSVSIGIISIAINNMGKALSSIGSLDWETIKKGLIGMGGALAEVTIFSNSMSNAKNVITTSASLVIVALALQQLYKPLSEIGSLDWETIKKGLIGMGGALLEIVGFSKLSSGIKGSITAAIGLGVAVSSLSTLAKALGTFGDLDWEAIKKGLVGMGGALAEIVLTMNMLSSKAPVNGLALIEICTSLNILTKAFEGFSTLSWEGIVKGIVATAAALGAISLAMKLIPEDSVFTALGLTGVASALVIMSKAMTTMSGLSWEGIAKGITAIGASIVLLAGGIKLMEGSLSGAAALIVAATALNLLVPAILQLSTISWEGLILSLTTLAGTIAVLGISAALLTPVIPAMLSLSTALVVLGLALVGIGAGIALATLGLNQLSQSFTTLDGTTQQGAANVATAMTAMVEGIANGIPTVISKIAEGIIQAVQYLTDAIPQFVDFVMKTIIAITDSIAQNAPLILDNVLKTLSAILDELTKWVPTITQKVVDLILAILQVMADNVSKFVDAGTNIIVNFLNGISNNLPKVIDAAFNLITTFINGLADAIRGNSGPISDACLNLVTAIVDGIKALGGKFIEAGEYAVKGFLQGLGSMAGKIVEAGTSLGARALEAAKHALDEHSPSKAMRQVGIYAGEGLVIGLDKMGDKVYDAGYGMGDTALNSMSSAISGISDIVNSNIDSNPVISPVLDLTNVKNGSNKLYGMMDSFNDYGLNGSVNIASSTAGSMQTNSQVDNSAFSNNLSNSLYNNQTASKQPMTLQLVLQNGKAIAEYIIDDVDSLMGAKNKITGRMVGVW